MQGSPPRMRERQQKNVPQRNNPRITPAYAGKTVVKLSHNPEKKDHPRVCGKDDYEKGYEIDEAGSPPRMRERLFSEPFGRFPVGITPAYAGKTLLFFAADGVAWDHPRVCGKDCLNYFPILGKQGSPPRMRERHAGGGMIMWHYRITPAYAGKTIFS